MPAGRESRSSTIRRGRMIEERSTSSTCSATSVFYRPAGFRGGPGVERRQRLFTAATRGVRALYTVTTHGRISLIAEAPSPLTLLDVSLNHQLWSPMNTYATSRKSLSAAAIRSASSSWLDFSAVQRFRARRPDDPLPMRARPVAAQIMRSYIHVESMARLPFASARASPVRLSPDQRSAICIDSAPKTVSRCSSSRQEPSEIRQLVTPGLHHESGDHGSRRKAIWPVFTGAPRTGTRDSTFSTSTAGIPADQLLMGSA